MAVNLEVSPRSASLIKTSILARWSESAIDSNAPDDMVLKLSEISIAETAQRDGLAAEEEDIGEPPTFLTRLTRRLNTLWARKPPAAPGPHRDGGDTTGLGRA